MGKRASESCKRALLLRKRRSFSCFAGPFARFSSFGLHFAAQNACYAAQKSPSCSFCSAKGCTKVTFVLHSGTFERFLRVLLRKTPLETLKSPLQRLKSPPKERILRLLLRKRAQNTLFRGPFESCRVTKVPQSTLKEGFCFAKDPLFACFAALLCRRWRSKLRNVARKCSEAARFVQLIAPCGRTTNECCASRNDSFVGPAACRTWCNMRRNECCSNVALRATIAATFGCAACCSAASCERMLRNKCCFATCCCTTFARNLHWGHGFFFFARPSAGVAALRAARVMRTGQTVASQLICPVRTACERGKVVRQRGKCLLRKQFAPLAHYFAPLTWVMPRSHNTRTGQSAASQHVCPVRMLCQRGIGSCQRGKRIMPAGQSFASRSVCPVGMLRMPRWHRICPVHITRQRGKVCLRHTFAPCACDMHEANSRSMGGQPPTAPQSASPTKRRCERGKQGASPLICLARDPLHTCYTKRAYTRCSTL